MKRALVAGALVVVSSLGLGACYRHTYVNPSATPGMVGYSSWHHHLIGGLVNLSGVVNLQAVCPTGVAEVHNRMGVLNWLLTVITGGIYAPTTVEVICNGGGGPVSIRIDPTPEMIRQLQAEHPNLSERLVASGARVIDIAPNRALASSGRTTPSM